MLMDLSIIIPTANEWPQILFTLRSISEDLRDRCDFEVIVVDNFCDELKAQSKTDDGTRDHLLACARGHKWLKVLHYTDKLSHWQAKNMGVKASSGKHLMFIDAHCAIARDSIFEMQRYYRREYEWLNGTLHLPLTYHIMEYHKLIYKLAINYEAGDIHYTFSSFRPSETPYEVPAMSTCGMMMSREIYNKIGGWPAELGIYGGGENFINFTLAVLGMKKWIWPAGTCFHHGSKRGYSWNGDDFTRNRCIANYMFGGEEVAKNFITHRRGNRNVLDSIYADVMNKCKGHREIIKRQQIMTIKEWINRQ
jgi:glycosyltransferase involved in cell wall biosynthesis